MGGFRQVLLRAVDGAALRAASLIVVDTDEHLEALPARHRRRAVVVPVGASEAWFEAADGDGDGDGDGSDGEQVLRVVFYGLFTPLQGTATIGKALRLLADQPGPSVRTTMIGHGQDLAQARAQARAEAGQSANVRWLD